MKWLPNTESWALHCRWCCESLGLPLEDLDGAVKEAVEMVGQGKKYREFSVADQKS